MWCLVPAHAHAASLNLLQSLGSSTVYATMICTREINKSTRNNHYLSNRSRSLNSAAVPSSSTGGADLPIHRTMSGKADHVAGFPKSRINRNYTQEDRTAGKMDKITQVSVAAIFSRRSS